MIHENDQTVAGGFSRKFAAPFIYAAQFSKKQDIIMAGGAGSN